MTIAERIKQKREEHELTQVELGDKLGVSKQYIGMLEAGKKNLSVAILIGLCRVFNCPADEVLGLENVKKRKVG